MSLLDIFSAGDNAGKLKKINKQVDAVMALDEAYAALSDHELVEKTTEFKQRYADGETLDALLPDVFAQVREAAFRVLGMKPYRVQVIGGIVLHQGRIAEMKTGEGKTLVATMPAVLNAIAGSVHIVTVNNYLAKRDSEWMGKVYQFLGYSVGLVTRDIEPPVKQKMYACDIIYGTNNEFGFDYLRDNMVSNKAQLVQGELTFAILDEVDSILIDEARTPLIISGAGEKSTHMYERADQFVTRLKKGEIVTDDRGEEEKTGDFIVEEKDKSVTLTEAGVTRAEQFFRVDNLSDVDNTELNHHIKQALKARHMMKRDIDYVVQNGEVIIIDEFTGRLMIGRRYSDGLHQAIEAKERVKVARESKTLATITFQNYFKMYKKLSGMTGTAKTEEAEFQGIYSLDVVEIPTNKPVIRDDAHDVIYGSKNGKFNAVLDEISRAHKTGQPLLVGTISVETSEYLSRLLKGRGIKHEVLNAKFHEKEADIVAQAGKFGAVTIATNMAGRGTDIVLGGNPDYMARNTLKKKGMDELMIESATSHAETDDAEIMDARKQYSELVKEYKKETDIEHQRVLDAGGLYIIGTERHESRRIDNQLRGRAGRQGDPGASMFFVSLEDDLMRLFGGERVQNMLTTLNPADDVPIQVGLISRQIENAQKKIEARNFEIRKNVLEYDDVINKQRQIIYEQRKQVLEGQDVQQNIMDMLETVVAESIPLYCPADLYPEEWDIDGLERHFENLFLPKGTKIFDRKTVEDLTLQKVNDILLSTGIKVYEAKEKYFTDQGANMRNLERWALLKVVDEKWMDHIDMMDQLKEGIRLRAYGQRDPIVEFRREGFDMFEEMIGSIQQDTLRMLYFGQLSKQPAVREAPKGTANYGDGGAKGPAKSGKKVGRNDPCPCGSGKKYKNCHGKEA
ncbi:MAG: preprotein translocase subunit SecA [Eubacteriales bacterium]